MGAHDDPIAGSPRPDRLSDYRGALEQQWNKLAAPSRPLQLPRDTGAVREEVAKSWQRSLHTVDPAQSVAPGFDDISDRWSESPLVGVAAAQTGHRTGRPIARHRRGFRVPGRRQ